ncbi:YtxH domain-containing protein [Arthrobacter sp. Z4-13]
MKNKFLLGVGIAAGYVLGSRSGRAAYDKLKARAAGIWDSKPVQDKVSVATEAIKEKAPEVADQLTEAARRAGTVIGSAMHRDGGSGDSKSTSDGATTTAASAGTAGTRGGTSGGTPAGTTGGSGLDSGHIPAHSTHPETLNLDTSSGEPESKA